MGLFDNLKKFAKDVSEDFEKSGMKDDFSKMGKEFVSSMEELGKNASELVNNVDKNVAINNQTDSVKTEKVKEIPERYNDFPRLEKKFVRSECKETSKYYRCSMDYKDVTDDEINAYRSTLLSQGFVKSTDVRFDKDNTYVIVDPNGSYGLNIVFHIKK